MSMVVLWFIFLPYLLDGLNVPQTNNFLQLKFVVIVQSQEVNLFSTSATK